MRLIIVGVSLTLSLLSNVSAAENTTGWDPTDLALAFETIHYAVTACDLALPAEAMTANVTSAGEALGIGGDAFADLMAKQKAKVKQLAELSLPAFCWQAESVARQFKML